MKRFLILLLSLVLLFALTSCGVAQVQPAFNTKTAMAPLADNLIAENDTYRLDWNEENYGVILTNKVTGEVWGTSPKESDEVKLDSFGMPVKRHEMVNSVLSVYYRDKKSNTDNNNIYSYNGVVENGHVRCARIENGVHVEYYFDSKEFMIPVDFVLYEDHLTISVNPKLIQENKNIVTSVSIAPFFCSAENDTEDAYLFVPSGSGALISTETDSLQGQTFSAPVYGEDLAQEKLYDVEKQEAVRMPVFGVDNGSNGTFAIIEGAAEAASIEAIAGGEAYSYSTVFPTFQVRGYTEHQTRVFSSAIRTYIIYAEAMISQEMKVSFYPLSSLSECDYSVMAHTYRSYLKENGKLPKASDTLQLNVNIIGGSQVTKSFLGVPYETVYPTTTVAQAKDIVSDLSKTIKGDLSVNLKGFGSSGIDVGEIAGGYNVSGKIGNTSEIKKLDALCRDKKIDLFMDFDLVRYSSSANGFSTFFDNASTAGNQKVSQYVYDKAINTHKKSEIYYILSPWQFENAAKKLISKSKKLGVSGISLTSLTSLSYSDYSERSDNKYYSKVGFADTVEKVMKTIGKEKRILAANANIYAALLADAVVDTPTSSSKSFAFFADVPFYQMVLRGHVPMTTESINLSDEPENVILKAVESGSGLNYTVISQWNNALIDSNYSYFYSSVYSDVKDDIGDSVKRLSDYYESIGKAGITSNNILENGLRVTEFDNGVKVYVNYTDTPLESPAGTVEAKDYLVEEGAY